MDRKERKGMEVYLYSTILADTPLTKRSDIEHRHLRRPNCDQIAFVGKKDYRRQPSTPTTSRAQSRLDDRTKMTSKPSIFDDSEDEDKDEEPTNIARTLSKDRPRCKDRHEVRTSSEDPSRRHRKKDWLPQSASTGSVVG